jgi:hypothetical protein
MTRRQYEAVAGTLAALLTVAVGVTLSATVPALFEKLLPHNWGELSAAGFTLALLAAWVIGTLNFTPNRRHR